ncbi:MAG: DMT family transporter [Bacteroidales bacterium]|nr:DMT family transporter [Bacteroidales bacterium]
MIKNHPPALLAAFSANLIYGLNYVVAKGIMPDYLQPGSIIFLRVIGAALVFNLFFYLTKSSEKVEKRHLLRIAIAAFFGIALNQMLFFEGLNLTSPINASIIMVGVPIIVIVLSSFVLHEPLTRIKIIGVILGFSGAAYLILNQGVVRFSSNTFAGNLLIFGNATSYSLYLIMIKPLFLHYKPLTIVRWLFFFGAMYIIPYTFQLVMTEEWSMIPLNIWLSIGYVIVFTTILAYFLNNYSLSRISPTANSAFIYTQPFFATLVALSLNQDKLRFMHLISALLIFAGVYLVSRTPGFVMKKI